MNIPFTPVLANLSPMTMIFVFFILLMMFGAKKLPDLAKGLGQAIREFSKAKNDIQDEILREPTPQPAKQIETQTVQTQAVPGTQPIASQPAAPVSTDHHSGTAA